MPLTGHSSPPRSSIGQWLDRLAATNAGDIAYIFAETARRLTWADVRRQVRHTAARLAGLGLAQGESLAYLAPNGEGATMTFLAAAYGGFRATPINLAAGPEAIGYALAHSRARFVLCDPARRDLLDAALAAGGATPTILDLDPDHGPVWPNGATEAAIHEPNADDEALLMYTSGTTGWPKGVVHTHASLLAGGFNAMLAHRLTAADRGLCVLPIYHINGLCVTVMGALVSASSLIMPHAFSASRFWRLAGEHEATWFSVVPTIVSHLLHRPRSEHPDAATRRRIRFGRAAGAALSPDVHAAFEAAFSIAMIESMGLTETAAQILANPLPPAVRKPGSAGIPFGNACIIGDDRGNELPSGETGEVLVRGANVMKGYLDNPEANAEAFAPGGWFRTGDLGHRDQDGYFFITGRLKELIIKGGENIAPREIDEALLAHPHVVEAAAFAMPCEVYGERIEAAVMVNGAGRVDEETLLELCRERLGAFKSPDRIHFLDTLPKGPSGKIQRRRIADMVSEK